MTFNLRISRNANRTGRGVSTCLIVRRDAAKVFGANRKIMATNCGWKIVLMDCEYGNVLGWKDGCFTVNIGRVLGDVVKLPDKCSLVAPCEVTEGRIEFDVREIYYKPRRLIANPDGDE